MEVSQRYKISSENFADTYFSSVLEILQKEIVEKEQPSKLRMDDFYKHLFKKVADKIGFSESEIKYLHHPFHWTLFLGQPPFLGLIYSKVFGEGYLIKLKNGMPEKSKLISSVLEKHGKLLEARIENLGNQNHQ
jgi:hypothetical protein